ncbi:SOS3-interacting protein 1 [Perilla frutescens var. hirtella]|uniref:non-specific serine/threonine protein kinase n=1 Tax=Perilla frutescens var. hirtella TaxID=608512 RepID=A0AAD4J684_PERFH|nr:SOS3-interacting protein 1 [Perilla frutescens var. hirtella]
METKEKILMKKYEVGRMLGQGSFAKVYYGRNVGTGQSVAIKVIDKGKVVKAGLMNQTKREISIMKLVRHQNVMHLEEVMATKTKIYFVMEYAKGGELFKVVAKGRLKENTARKYFQQLICAVNFCHSRGVYHRDLKPENLLLDENGELKVSDFGLSAVRESKRQDGLLHTTCGTPAYVAPEIISRKGYDGAKADIWSCGVILFVLLAGYLPFHERNLMEMYRKIAKADYKCPHWFPPQVRRLLSTILDTNPNTRISIANIMENPWFQKGLNSINAGDAVAKPFQSDDTVAQTNVEMARPDNLNAFDIISLSAGFDLSALFVTNDHKDDIQFTSTSSASSIVSKLEDVARQLRFKLTKKDQGSFRLEEGTMSIDIEIFQISPSFHLVQMNKCSGDFIEYQHLLSQNIRPALKEVVWSWLGEQQHH